MHGAAAVRSWGAALLSAAALRTSNVRCYCMLQGCVFNGSSSEFAAGEKMKEVLGMMASYGGILPNRRTYALSVEGFLKDHELEVRTWGARGAHTLAAAHEGKTTNWPQGVRARSARRGAAL